MQSRLPSDAEIDELAEFLPRLYRKGFEPIRKWSFEDGTAFPSLEYEKDVEEFMEVASKDCWCDYQYVPEEASKMLEERKSIENASLEEIKTMLTFCMRWERFNDGHVAAMIEDGKIEAILKRLLVLRDESA